jgi:hypothetical protein
MTDKLITTAFAIVSLTFLIAGIAAILLPPEKYSILMKQIGITGSSVHGKARRVAGAALALIGIVFISQIRVVNWLAFALGAGVLFCGIFVLIWPRPLLSWFSSRLFQQNAIPDHRLRVWNIAIRAMGAAMMYASTDLFRVSMGH